MDEDNETVLLDLVEPGKRLVFLRGGDGGFGKRPLQELDQPLADRKDEGWPGHERWVWLRLKLIADAGLVGLPNAGKSTFPGRGLPRPSEDRRLPVHDPEAATGRRLCRRREVRDGRPARADRGGERRGRVGPSLPRPSGAVQRHAASGRRHAEDVVGAYRTIRQELKAYGHGLVDKPEIIGLNKTDALAPTRSRASRQVERAAKAPVLALVGATGGGVEAVLRALCSISLQTLAAAAAARDDDRPYSPVSGG